jgi:hypothetical protein
LASPRALSPACVLARGWARRRRGAAWWCPVAVPARAARCSVLHAVLERRRGLLSARWRCRRWWGRHR